MDSSFTDQPSPQDFRPEEDYTATPPRGREADEDRDAGLPKLGSLAQKARSKKLRQARIIFFLVGAVTIVVNLIDIGLIRSNFQQAVQKEIQKQGGPGIVQLDRAALQKEEDNAFALGCAIDGAFIFAGVIFLVLGALVYRFPVPVTILGLVLYLSTFAAGLAIVALFNGEPEEIARYLGRGWLVRILIIVGLASSIKSALAYEKERRAETDFGPLA
jgi:hypothetical protein